MAKDLPLAGDTSRWDYQTYDASAHRLYIAHLGASEIVVFDTRLQRVVGVVRGVDQVHRQLPRRPSPTRLGQARCTYPTNTTR